MFCKMCSPRICGVKWIYSTLILICFTQVQSSGVFELKLISFSNVLGLRNDSSCCVRTGNGALCSESCRTKFRVCLNHYEKNISANPRCTFGSAETPVLGENSFNITDTDTYSNPVTLPFTFSWPGTFSLIIEARHQQSSEESGLILRLATSRTVQVDQEWRHDVATNPHGAHLSYAYRVRCDPHYYGEACAVSCVGRDDRYGHWTCGPQGEKVCLEGWTGNYCDTAYCKPGCHEQYGYCEQPGQCRCKHGWEGEYCDQCIKYPGCKHGTCQKPWDCICDEGWGGLFCNQDLNYCTNHKPCKNGATCTNTGQGSYTCSCLPGFTGTNCEVVLDNCAVSPCLNGGTCNDIGSNFSCTCTPGYHGRRCETDASTSCAENPCQNGATCIDTQDSYTCLCQPGFDGVNCDHEINECESSPCSNGGMCVDLFNGFECICKSGFKGNTCEDNVDECSFNPCKNGGTCIDKVNSFVCHCIPGFLGSLCQTNVDDCLTNPCANGGTCTDLVNDYSCTCQPGFTGKDCSVNVNECTVNKCKNGGRCIDHVNYFTCECARGFTGKKCEIPTKSRITPSMAIPTSSEEPSAAPGRNDSLKAEPEEENGDNDELSSSHVILIVVISVTLPVLAILLCVIVIFCRRRRRKSDSDIEAKKQNKQNQQNSMNNRSTKDSNIVSSIHPAGSNVCLKVTNEDIDTLKKPTKNIVEKSSKQFLTDSLIHEQLKSVEKVSNRKLDDGDSSLDPTLPGVHRSLDDSRTSEQPIEVYVDKSHRSDTPTVYVIEKHYHHGVPAPTNESMLATEV